MLITRADALSAPASGWRTPREAVVAAPTSGPITKIAVTRCKKKRTLNTGLRLASRVRELAFEYADQMRDLDHVRAVGDGIL